MVGTPKPWGVEQNPANDGPGPIGRSALAFGKCARYGTSPGTVELCAVSYQYSLF